MFASGIAGPTGLQAAIEISDEGIEIGSTFFFIVSPVALIVAEDAHRLSIIHHKQLGRRPAAGRFSRLVGAVLRTAAGYLVCHRLGVGPPVGKAQRHFPAVGGKQGFLTGKQVQLDDAVLAFCPSTEDQKAVERRPAR